MTNEMATFIRESESDFSEGWVPATYIKDQLRLKKSSYPQGNEIDNETGWLFATMARHLQDQNQVKFKKTNNRSYYRSKLKLHLTNHSSRPTYQMISNVELNFDNYKGQEIIAKVVSTELTNDASKNDAIKEILKDGYYIEINKMKKIIKPAEVVIYKTKGKQ